MSKQPSTTHPYRYIETIFPNQNSINIAQKISQVFFSQAQIFLISDIEKENFALKRNNIHKSHLTPIVKVNLDILCPSKYR